MAIIGSVQKTITKISVFLLFLAFGNIGNQNGNTAIFILQSLSQSQTQPKPAKETLKPSVVTPEKLKLQRTPQNTVPSDMKKNNF